MAALDPRKNVIVARVCSFRTTTIPPIFSGLRVLVGLQSQKNGKQMTMSPDPEETAAALDLSYF